MSKDKPWLWALRGHTGVIFAPSRNAATFKIFRDARRAGTPVWFGEISVRRYYPAWMESTYG